MCLCIGTIMGILHLIIHADMFIGESILMIWFICMLIVLAYGGTGMLFDYVIKHVFKGGKR